MFAYNAGRIASYCHRRRNRRRHRAGRACAVLPFASLQIGGYWLANLMLVALGLYLMDAWRGLARLEALGQHCLAPPATADHACCRSTAPAKASRSARLWGWVPCGMVYSVLLTAMLSGSAASGALAMLAFGAGTLPVLLAMGMLGTRLQVMDSQRRAVRVAAAWWCWPSACWAWYARRNGVSHGWLDASASRRQRRFPMPGSH